MRINWFLALNYWVLKLFVVGLKNKLQFGLARWHEMAYILESHSDTLVCQVALIRIQNMLPKL